jgi:predicted sugar kinase
MAEELRVIIRFKDGITKATTDFLTEQGAEVKHVFGSINAVSAKIPADKMELLKSDPSIEYIEEDQTATILVFPEEPLTDEQKKALATAQIIPWGVAKIRVPEVWPSGNMGMEVRVCIIDTGITYNHPDLKDNYKGGFNFVNNTPDPLDDNGHGTHVAGTIAAMDNDIGVVGVAPKASIYSLKALDNNGSGSYSNIIAAIQWAIDNNMQIVSMSFGGSSYSKALEDICNAAYNGGILLVAAAGNNGGDGSKDTVGYPAKYDSVIAVAATDSNDVRASFSSVGAEVEVAAPGVSIPSTVPTSGTKYSDPSGYKSLSGTSMACPHTSGTAALVMKADPNLANADVRKILSNTSVDLGSPGRDVFYGFGRIDAKAAVDNTSPQPPVLTKIDVTPATASLLVGETQEFKATALDQRNNPMASIEISWGVDNPSVGSVTPPSSITGPDGIAITTFTALAAGNTAVNASNGTVKGSAGITVTTAPPQPVLTKIDVTPATASLLVGETQEFKATALDQRNNPMASIEISWGVDNPSVGSVTPPSSITGPDGIAITTFTALAAGNTAVNASNGTVKGSAGITVTTAPPQPVLTKIDVTPATASLLVGETQEFKATALDQRNNPMASIEISWGVDNPSVGSVTPPSSITGPDGIAITTFTALAAGNTAVNASNGTVKGTAGITVTTAPPQPVLTKIDVTPATATLLVGETQEFKATAFDQRNNPMASIEISWDVDNPSVGSVTPPSSITGPDGIAMTTFTALAAGNTAVNASNGTVKGSASVTVKVPPPPEKKFTVYPLGIPSKPSGILVLKRTKGDFDASEACAKVCALLKEM